ncbi:MFS transporter [Klebsiella pneumoniae]
MSFITNLNQQQRKRLHQITLVATFGGLLFGYDTGVINGAFSSLKQYMALTPTTEGLVMSVLLVGAALGSVFGGKFADYFGRRKYIAIVLCFRGISSVTGFSEAIWQVIITLAIIISTWYSANYFAALEARRDKRRYLLLAWVVMTILLNFIHLGGG